MMSGLSNPQNLNRFSYVANNPLRYTDPTGHMACIDFDENGQCIRDPDWSPADGSGGSSGGSGSDGGGGSDGGSSDGSSGDSNVGGGSVLPMPSPTDPECTTVFCRALEGDLGAIVDLLVPTHVGWRLQGEGAVDLAFVIPNFSISISGGGNIAYNRYSDQLAMSVDWAIEPGFGIGAGGSVTTGPLLGWGSSRVEDVTTGTSGLISGTAAYIAALSGGVSSPWPLKDDPVYGVAPATLYGGAGVGGDYAGVGAGPSTSVLNVDLSFLLPSHW